MRFDHLKGRGQFADSSGSGDSGPGGPEGKREISGTSPDSGRYPSSEDEESPKVVPLERPRQRGIWKDPYKFGLVLQLCLTVLLISLLIYCLFPFFAMMDRLDIPVKRVVYIPVAIVVVVLFFTRRAVRLIRRLREGKS
jgi:hypothetical protein